MSKWIEINSIRHQVAISGRVSDQKTGQTLPGAIVEIIEMPEGLQTKLELLEKLYGSDWKNLAKRLDQTRTTPDGYFYFLDLPDGAYQLVASLPSAGTRYQKQSQSKEIEVFRQNQGNNKDKITRVHADITLAPTGIEGIIKAEIDDSAIMMAKVWLEGSGEFTFSDSQGYYLLTGIEASHRHRTVKVAAQGYHQLSAEPLTINQGELITIDFPLTQKNGYK